MISFNVQKCIKVGKSSNSVIIINFKRSISAKVCWQEGNSPDWLLKYSRNYYLESVDVKKVGRLEWMLSPYNESVTAHQFKVKNDKINN